MRAIEAAAIFPHEERQFQRKQCQGGVHGHEGILGDKHEHNTLHRLNPSLRLRHCAGEAEPHHHCQSLPTQTVTEI